MTSIDNWLSGRDEVRRRAPLVHCLTNLITAGDCANALLAVGAKPIMALHPGETEEITRGADALLINLGNISDLTMEAMRLSLREANRRDIPVTLDLVGVGCSALRLGFALELVERYRFAVVKGNLSEVSALKQRRTLARGVDAREEDLMAGPQEIADCAGAAARDWECTVAVSGPVDVAATAGERWAVRGGHPMMGLVTGTGCVLGVLTAACTSVSPALPAVVLAAALEGLAGEQAGEKAPGPGTFRGLLMDGLYGISTEELRARTRLERM